MSTTKPPAKDPRDAFELPETSRTGGRIGLQSLSRFCHNIGTGLHAGVDVRRVFETESNRGTMLHRNKVIEIRDHVARGASVSSAIKASNGYFPPLLCEMVEVGERTGRLEQIFIRLGEYYDQLVKLRRTFLMGIAWPMLELVGAILVIGLFILIIGMVSDEPPMTFFGLYGVRGAIIYFTIVGLIGGSIGLTIVSAMKGWVNLDPIFSLLMRLPFIGTGLQNVALSRLTWALAMATDSDLSAQRAVELAVRTTQSTYYMRFIDGMKNVIGRGKTIHEAFATTGVYPDEFLASVETGEIAGSLSETMLIVSRDYEERTKTFFRVLTGVAGTLVFLTVAGIIITMIFKMAMQYIGILNDAANF
ncbi:MAG: type II secretion system F family protein [Planctomycetaceae bacterium]|nr:type II secretion system F family protein [Planctomycetales bacterium]MCB9937041.1 type II secretion system F family protein [Planctomycetaceae bacterium]